MTKHIICVFTLDQALDLGMYLTIIITIFGIFLYIVNVIDLEHIDRYFGKNEWNKMFDAWVYFCFKIDGFEIFLTETKGLGIK